MSDLIHLTPVFHTKIWGGRKLNETLGYDIPDGPVGECWAISAHPHGDCVVSEGPFAGTTLSELWKSRRDLFGNLQADTFPLLIKIIDANQDLSIQVHPDDAYAASHEAGSLGKRECWYVIDCEPNAHIIVGQHAQSREEFLALSQAGRWDELLNEIPIAPGDFFQIDPGCVHAIKGGTLILETQQSSDITYRVYDYDRMGEDGKPRELHLEKSLDVIDYHATAPQKGRRVTVEPGCRATLESNANYTVELIRVDGPYLLEQRWPFMCLSVIAGSGTIQAEPAQAGTHLLTPASCTSIELDGQMTLILSHL